jgi:putative ABC transport system permease protein
MADELAFHLDMETANNIRAGMDPAAARRAARIAFGGVDRTAEELRDVRNIAWLDVLAQDLRYAARTLRRSPGFAVSAIAALSLGIGANTAVYSVVHAVVIAPLPYAAPDRLVQLWEANPAQRVERGTVSPGTFIDLRERSRTLERVAMFAERTMVFSSDGETWQARAASVSPEIFDLLGVRPIAGPGFGAAASEPQGRVSNDEVLIAYDVWQRRFGGDTAVIGRTLRLDWRWSYRIVGVLPPGFAFPLGIEVWAPLVYGPTVSPVERQYRYYSAIARLRPGATLEQAARETAGIATQLEAEYPASNAGWTVRLSPLDRSIVGSTRPTLLVLLSLAGCVLLITCGNVATLAVARTTSRRHEIAVRMALGAARSRLVRQWTTETLLLALLGGAGGLVVGYWSNRLLLAIAPRDIPRLDEVTFGASVLSFVVLVSCAVAVLVGLAPALRARDATPLDAMRTRTSTGGSGGARPREWLGGAQVALKFVLTLAAALLLRSFEHLQATELGYRRSDVLAAEVRVPTGRFPGTSAWFQRVGYYERLMADLSRIPGVRSIGGTSSIPLVGERGTGAMWSTDAPGAHGIEPPTSAADQWKAAIHLVTPRYFETVGIPLIRGRPFDDRDRFGEAVSTHPDLPRPPGVAIINEAMARRYWPGSDPLGATIFIFDDKSFAAYRTIVGVVADARVTAVDSAAAPTVFLPYAQNSGYQLSLAIRTTVPPLELVRTVTDRIRAFDSAISIASVRPFDDVFGAAVARPRFAMVLAAAFAVLALLIASVGVFGIVGFLVAQRTQELGIRVALGAQPSNVLWLVLSQGLRPVLLGLVAGGAGAIVVALAMRALLYGLAPLDRASFAMAAGLLVITSLVAAVVPARRAAGVDPLRSLRND